MMNSKSDPRIEMLEQRLLVVSCDGGVNSDRSREVCSLIVGLPEEKKFQERNGGKAASFANPCEKRET
jgi:hypothetical protein